MTRPDGAPLLHLPVVYAVALALRDAGVPAAEIAERLELSPASLPALFEIAEAKLSSLRGSAVGGGVDGDGDGDGEIDSPNPGPGSVPDPQGSRTE